MTIRRGKVTISASVSRFAEKSIEKAIDRQIFPNRSNAPETAWLPTHFVLNSKIVIEKAAEFE